MPIHRKLRTLGPLYGLARREVAANPGALSSFAAAAVLQAGGHAATAVVAGLLGKSLFFDQGPGQSPSVHPSPGQSWAGHAAALTLVGLASVLVKGGGATWTATVQSRIAHRVGHSVRAEVTARLLAGGAARPGPEVAARVALQVREVERGIDEGLLATVRASLQLVPLAAALVVVSPTLALGAAVLLVPFGVGLAAARRSWRGSHARAMALAEALHAQVDELVRHADVWRTYGAGAKVQAELDRLGQRAGEVASRAEAGRAALSAANEALAALALVAAVLGARWIGAPIAGGTLVTFATVLFMTYRPLRDLGDARSAATRGALALAALEELTVAPSRRAELPKKKFEPATLAVEGLGVVRGGPVATTSFTLAPGEIVALVGPTGAGKTTLLRALLGLEPSLVGRVRYGGEELTHAAVGPSARPFAWVPQEAPVLAGTLAENVVPDRDDSAAARAALATIGAEPLERELAEATLGAAGRSLSGGERRLVALARAIATDAPVLLLDEPTEGLDELTQARVVAALARLRGRRSLVIVTHRNEPARIADRVVTFGGDESAAGSVSRP